MDAGVKLRIGFDNDGCLDNFGEGVRETLVARGEGHLWKSGPTKKPFWNWYEDWGKSWEWFKELCDWGVDKGIIFTGHWREGAVEAVKKVKDLGHTVIIITDRAFGSNELHSQQNTIAGLKAAGIPYDELHFSKNKLIVPTDMFVEDKIENYDALVQAGVEAYLINRPWNEVNGGDDRRRINSVSEYAALVELKTMWLNNLTNSR